MSDPRQEREQGPDNVTALRRMVRRGVPLEECVRWAVVERGMRFTRYIGPGVYAWGWFQLNEAQRIRFGVKGYEPVVVIIEGVTLLDRRPHGSP